MTQNCLKSKSTIISISGSSQCLLIYWLKREGPWVLHIFHSTILSLVHGLVPWMDAKWLRSFRYHMHPVKRHSFFLWVSLFVKKPFPETPADHPSHLLGWKEASPAFPATYHEGKGYLYTLNHRKIYSTKHEAHVSSTQLSHASSYKTLMYRMEMYYQWCTNSAEWLNADYLKVKTKNKSWFVFLIVLALL